FDLDRQLQRLGDNLGGLQRPGEGTGEQPFDLVAAQNFGGSLCLPPPLFGQHRIHDAGVDPGLRVMYVEFGLAVANQDHGCFSVLSEGLSGGFPSGSWRQGDSALPVLLSSSGVISRYSPSMTVPPPCRAAPPG